jgi:8-oxo-dGTP diphosphatase
MKAQVVHNGAIELAPDHINAQNQRNKRKREYRNPALGLMPNLQKPYCGGWRVSYSPSAVLALMWEFPGGRVEDAETDVEALRREVRHRLDTDVQVGALISYVSHAYENYVVDLHLYECRIIGGEPRAAAVHDFRWVRSDEFEQYPFTPADEASMSKLLGEG